MKIPRPEHPRIILAVWAAILAGPVGGLALGACTPKETKAESSKEAQGSEPGILSLQRAGEGFILKDHETGCEYIFPVGSGRSPVPRMGRDGKQVCR